VSLEKAQNYFLEAQTLCRNRGSQFLFVYLPTKFRVYQDFSEFSADSQPKHWRLSDLPIWLESWANTNGVSYLDLTPVLKQAAGRRELVYFPDDEHWNDRGNELAAEAVTAFIKANGWLRQTQGSRVNTAHGLKNGQRPQN